MSILICCRKGQVKVHHAIWASCFSKPFLWVEQAGAGRAGMPGGQKHKKETNKQTKNNPKRGGAKRRPFLDDFCRFICLFVVFLTPRHPCSASPCLLNP